MGDKVENRVAQEKETKGIEFDATFTEQIKQHREQADCLFYRLLEKVAVAERERASGIEVPDLSVSDVRIFKLFDRYPSPSHSPIDALIRAFKVELYGTVS